MTERRMIPPPIPVMAEIAAVKNEKKIKKIGMRILRVILFTQIKDYSDPTRNFFFR